MDIANYVGIFLLKNEYCFLPGIGSLQIEKQPTKYDRDAQQLSAPSFDVVFRQDRGSIDDTFANFIATNERISIAHAANEFKDFCAAAKQDLKNGQSVIFPGIGSLTATNNVIYFLKDAALQIEGRTIPYFKNSDGIGSQKEDVSPKVIGLSDFREPKANEAITYKAPSVNWGKVLTLIGIVVVLLGGAGFVFWNMSKDKPDEQPQVPQAVQPKQAVQATVATTDTTPKLKVDSATTAPVNVAADGLMNYKVVLNAYASKEKAAHRVATLKSYGHTTVDMVAKDSSTYYVFLPVTTSASDTTKVLDSLKRLYNPKEGVKIIK